MFLNWNYTLEFFFWILLFAIFVLALTILLSKPPKPTSSIGRKTVHSSWSLDKSDTLYDVEINWDIMKTKIIYSLTCDSNKKVKNKIKLVPGTGVSVSYTHLTLPTKA